VLTSDFTVLFTPSILKASSCKFWDVANSVQAAQPFALAHFILGKVPAKISHVAGMVFSVQCRTKLVRMSHIQYLKPLITVADPEGFSGSHEPPFLGEHYFIFMGIMARKFEIIM
jgi:hypothetical protein